ncbi:protein sip-5 [Stenotrophomonas chelatiphaga]|uniref:protein sip-5 n=1 Tax=Stenotrophomonas chelatiphaga TaxID=517011 RepID=UPI002896D99A|nr:protein sip-5 [Stenotrophomonas chelatiphaga]
MKFSVLRSRVKRCEQVVAVRLVDTQDHWGVLSQVWRSGWSPLRIIVAGVASGFVVGKLEIPGKVNGARWLQMVGSVSNLLASGQAAFASAMAAHAAGAADDAAEQADAAADKVDDAVNPGATAAAAGAAAGAAAAAAAASPPQAPAQAGLGRQDQDDSIGPRPAEAATELSER